MGTTHRCKPAEGAKFGNAPVGAGRQQAEGDEVLGERVELAVHHVQRRPDQAPACVLDAA